MKQIARLLKRRPTSRVTTTVYQRDSGPICYEANVLWETRRPEEFVSELLSSQLRWFWSSARTMPSSDSSSTLPDERQLVLLNEENCHDLLGDFIEQDIDGN